MKNTLIRGSLAIITLLLMTQMISSQELFSIDSITARIERQVKTFPQEKLYVHNDKPLYISGEKIWFRAHLVDSYSNKYDSTSIYVYGELINPLDSIVERVKIRRNNNLYAGQFSLLEDYPAGTYSMRFYTKFMESLGDEYFFKKNIEVGGPLSSKFSTDIDYEYTNDNSKLDVVLQFMDQTKEEVITPENIKIGYKKEHLAHFSGDALKKISLNSDQKVSFTLDVKKEPVKSIYVEYEYNGHFFSEFITINAPKDDFHVDFFAEGGNLLAGTRMNVAFKSLYSDGLSAKIEGVVCSEAGDTITSFSTAHNGMGTFPFLAKAEQKYVAICNTEDGMSKKFNLPEVVNNGYGLKVENTKKRVLISLQTANNEPLSNDLTLLIQSKGMILYAKEWDKNSQTIQIDRDLLPVGVVHCLLVTNDYTPISERLFFNNPTNYAPLISLENNKQEYLKRDKVTSKLKFSNNEGEPLNGNFSVSVTDNNDIKVDSTQNILTSLLLTSELKGYIESPSFYFNNSRLASYALDALMQTQGWRKYDMSKVLKNDIQKPTGILEYCQMIEGNVKSGILMTNKAKGIPLDLISLTNPFIISEVSDENGRFMFRTDLPDSLSLAIRATTKKGGDRIDLQIDNERYPTFVKNPPKYRIEKKQFNSYFEKADLKYLSEFGMRMINLDAIEITGIKVRKSTYSSPINTIYDSYSFKLMGAHTLIDVLQRIGGLRIETYKGTTSAFLRNYTNPALIYFNDMIYNDDILSYDLDISQIESVEVVKDGSTLIQGAQYGAILIMPKKDFVFPSIPPSNIKKIRPLGYQSTVEFYSPKYETVAQKNNKTPDLRTTLYWKPYVKIVDGKAEVSFYTADTPSNYTLVLEGLTDEGKPLHYTGTIGEK